MASLAAMIRSFVKCNGYKTC